MLVPPFKFEFTENCGFYAILGVSYGTDFPSIEKYPAFSYWLKSNRSFQSLRKGLELAYSNSPIEPPLDQIFDVSTLRNMSKESIEKALDHLKKAFQVTIDSNKYIKNLEIRCLTSQPFTLRDLTLKQRKFGERSKNYLLLREIRWMHSPILLCNDSG